MRPSATDVPPRHSDFHPPHPAHPEWIHSPSANSLRTALFIAGALAATSCSRSLVIQVRQDCKSVRSTIESLFTRSSLLRDPAGPIVAVDSHQVKQQHRGRRHAAIAPVPSARERRHESGDRRCGRISPSCRSAISMEFQTLGLGSSAALQFAPPPRRSDSILRPAPSTLGTSSDALSVPRTASVFHFRQALLQLNAIHTEPLPKSTCGFDSPQHCLRPCQGYDCSSLNFLACH